MTIELTDPITYRQKHKWIADLPTPYDIQYQGWTVIHKEIFNNADQFRFDVYQAWATVWDKAKDAGKEEFLKRNEISRENIQFACIPDVTNNYSYLCVIAKIPPDVRTLFHLEFR